MIEIKSDKPVLNIIYLNNKKYFIKVALKDRLGLELVMERLAHLAGINCAHYELSKINGDFCYLSEDIAGDKEFILGYDFLLKNNIEPYITNQSARSLYRIWEAFEKSYSDSNIALKLMNSIIKIYFFDLLFFYDDRHHKNWGVLQDASTKEIYILDNELAFEPRYNTTFLSSTLDPSPLKYPANAIEDEIFIDRLQELEYFLNSSSSEYGDMCLDMYNVLTPSVVEKTFNEVEQSEGITILKKGEYLELYKKHYERVGRLLNGRGLK